MSLRETWSPSGGEVHCDHPGCERKRRHYCDPTVRESWLAVERPDYVHDYCPMHRWMR